MSFMRDKTTTVIASVVGIMALFQFVIFPTMNRRAVKKVMKSILRDWKKGEMLPPMNYWYDRKKYPDFPLLYDYKVRNRQIFKKNNRLFSKYIVALYFGENLNIPVKSDWAFTLADTKKGWKVVDFRLAKLHPEDVGRRKAVYNAEADKEKLKQWAEKPPPPEDPNKKEEPVKEPPKPTKLKTIPAKLD